MKKINVKIIWRLLAFSAVLAFTNCQSLDLLFREPVVSLNSVKLAGISFTGAELLCNVNVENPNAFDIPFPEVGWNFFINTNSLFSGVIKNDEFIKSRRTTVVPILVKVDYVDLFNSIASLIGSKSVDYKIALDVKFTIAQIISPVFHFEHEGNLPILQIPKVSFGGIAVKNMSLTGLDFEISLEIENNNIFAMLLNRLSYNFSINNSRWTEGSAAQNISIAPDGKAVVPISFSINTLNMVTEITRIILGNTDVSYLFTGDLRLGLGGDLPILSDLGHSVNFNGTTRLRR